MLYLFEDDSRDILSKLYMEAYPEKMRRNFIYVRGNGELYKTAKNYLQYSDIAVFIDMVPDNDTCREIYIDLVGLSKDKNIKNRLLIFPIVCSEFYMIKSLYKYTQYIDKHHADVNICLNKGDYRKSSIYIHKGKPCKSFEKYCKAVLIRHVTDCVKHTSRFDDGTTNEKYGLYYCEDCLCDKSSDTCEVKGLKKKAIELLSVYDIVPSNSLAINKTCIDNDIINIHRKLVDDYNAMLAKYEALGIVKTTKGKSKKILYAM